MVRKREGKDKKTYGDNDLVSGGALLGKPLAEAAEGDAGGLLDDGVRVLEASLDDGPELGDVGADELGAALDGDAERHEGGLASRGVGRGHVGLNVTVEGGEDLGRREGLGEDVEDAEGELQKAQRGSASGSEREARSEAATDARGRVLVVVLRVLLATDGQQATEDGVSEVELLNLLGLVADGPKEGVERHAADLGLELLGLSARQEEVDEVGDGLGDEGGLLNDWKVVSVLRRST